MTKKKKYSKSEASLRDHLAANLTLIEPGLTLVAKEHRLPNAHGARGYIDILARDEVGHRVVIEIKRSNATARQALHELHKYVELLQENQGLSNADVRCIVVSTDWHELTIPFGQYQRNAQYPVEGFQVILVDGKVTRLKAIQERTAPVPIRPFRLHTGHFFADEKSCNDGLHRVQKGLTKAGVTSAILAIMRTTQKKKEIIYPHCIYVMIFDVSVEATEKYMSKVRQDSAINHDDPNGMEHLFEQEVVFAADTGMFNGNRKYTHESSWPEKFAAMIEIWKIKKFCRIGRLQDKSLFTDNDLRDHLLGFLGTGQIAYKGTASPAYPVAWNAAKQRIRRCLVGSKTWEQIAEHSFKLIEAMPGRATAKFHIYNPCDTVMMLFKLVGRNDPRFIPAMEIMWKSNATGDMHLVSGTIAWDGKTKPESPERILRRIFKGDAFDYFLARTVGEIAAFDPKVMRALGLSYQAAHFVGCGEKDAGRWIVPQRNGMVERELKAVRNLPLPEFIQSNIEFAASLVEWFESNSFGI